MSASSRRTLLASLGFGAGALLLPRLARATLVRGMTLPELLTRSRHALLGTAMDARCTYLTIGGQRLLVTETRFRVDAVLGLETPTEGELTVRTPGGRLGTRGELVDGQAEFSRGAPCAAFFERGPDGACWVTGMAQGHYPLEQSGGAWLLRASPRLPTIRDFEHSAVKRLAGTSLPEAQRLIAEAHAR